MSVITRTGALLRDSVNTVLAPIENSRTKYAEVRAYLDESYSKRVCCLYGLQRTGKTVMMHQAMLDYNDYEHTLYVLCNAGDTVRQLYDVIEANPGKSLICVDEVTRLEGFVDSCSALADIYMNRAPEQKIILSGTDSLAFSLASHDELYDRVVMIHTTYISYREFALVTGHSMDEYIRYGGTLTDGETFYNEDNLDEYVNEAIVKNILHTLERHNQGRSFGPLQKLYENGDLVSAINKAIELHNRTFTKSVINRAFKSHDLGSAINLMDRHPDVYPSSQVLRDAHLREEIMQQLSIVDFPAEPLDDSAVRAIQRYLVELDLVFVDPSSGEVFFTQPGMRYCQAVGLIKTILDSPELSEYSRKDRLAIGALIDEDIRGKMMEDIIRYDLTREFSSQENISVQTYTNTRGQEIDVLFVDDAAEVILAFEVKHSSQQAQSQKKFLLDDAFCAEVENEIGYPLVGKAVLYNGVTEMCPADGVAYINASEYLQSPREYNEAILRPELEDGFPESSLDELDR